MLQILGRLVLAHQAYLGTGAEGLAAARTGQVYEQLR